jgi:hypothetical protein
MEVADMDQELEKKAEEQTTQLPAAEDDVEGHEYARRSDAGKPDETEEDDVEGHFRRPRRTVKI